MGLFSKKQVEAPKKPEPLKAFKVNAEILYGKNVCALVTLDIKAKNRLHATTAAKKMVLKIGKISYK